MTAQNETNPARAPWGQHLVLDFNGCPKELLADRENILDWSKELVQAIDMVAYGEPIIEHFNPTQANMHNMERGFHQANQASVKNFTKEERNVRAA